MPIVYSPAISNYSDDRWNLLRHLEEVGGLPRLKVYVDSKGLATIGIGFLVSANAAQALRGMGYLANDAAIYAAAIKSAVTQVKNGIATGINFGVGAAGDFAAQQAIKIALRTASADPQAQFEFLTDGQVRTTFDLIIPAYEDLVSQWHPTGIAVPDDRERLALVSLAYNNLIGPATVVAGTVTAWKSPSLRRALDAGNRAEAWYEIRYNSNKSSLATIPPPDAAGLAKRRYAESQYFGLHNSGTVSLDQAQQTYQMLELHRRQIQSYEIRYASQVLAANSDYGFSSQNAVLTLEESLDAAVVPLLGWINAQLPAASLQISSNMIDRPSSIYMDPGRDNSTQPVSLNHAAKLDARIYGIPHPDTGAAELDTNNLLVGEGGGDTLIGGKGNDILLGGDGIDEYHFLEGDGLDSIWDSDGQGEILRDRKRLVLGLRQSGSVWNSVDGATFTPVNNARDLEIAFQNSADKITIRDFNFQVASADYLGIRLIDAPIAPSFGTPTQPQTQAPEILGDFEPELNAGTVPALLLLGPPEMYVPDLSGHPDWRLADVTGSDATPGNPPTIFQITYARVDANDNLILSATPAPGRDDTLKDSSANDKIVAGDGDNTITATRGGHDWIVTGTGNDTVTDSGGNNLIDTGAGTDNIFTYGTGDDWILAGEGNDIVNDVAGNNRIEAGAGDDVVNAGLGDDLILGGEGSDEIADEGGANLIDAGAGRDVVTGGIGEDWIEGGSEGDILSGREGDDVLVAQSSIGQTLTIEQAIEDGETGEQTEGPWDVLTGDAGDDVLLSGSGADFIAGGEGEEVIVGGAGDDTIYGDATVTGASTTWSVVRTRTDVNGAATFTVARSEILIAIDEEVGGLDVIYGGAGEDWVFAGAGDDTADGGVGNDVLFGEGGNDALTGGDGNDFLDGDSTPSVTAGLAGDDFLDGGAGDDELLGEAGNDILYGGDGYDVLSSGDGEDTLHGGTGIDVLVGGAGKDTYVYNAGDGMDIIDDAPSGPDDLNASVLVLGPGINPGDVKFRPNFLVVDLGEGNLIQFLHFNPEDPLSTPVLDAIEFQSGGFMTLEDVLEQGFDLDGTEEIDVLFGTPYTDRIDAKGGDDTVMGRAGDDAILGGTGDDWVDGAEGNDVIDGGEGSDQLAGYLGDDVLAGGSGDDALSGGDGNDALQGGDGADSLVGDDGDDSPVGGAGDDLLIGNAGSDTYVFTAGDGADLIDEQAFIAQGLADAQSTDMVRFDATVAPAQVSLLRGANGDLTIRYGTTDSVTIAGQYMGAAQSIERIEFNDGTVIDKAALDAVTTAPIEGTAGDDFLSGTPGNDTLAGAAGADSYAVYLGMGRDTLVDGSPSAAEVGTLQLAAGLSLDSLKARQVGDDLAVDIRGTNAAGRWRNARGGIIGRSRTTAIFPPTSCGSISASCPRRRIFSRAPSMKT